jgi:hypothetical protein
MQINWLLKINFVWKSIYLYVLIIKRYEVLHFYNVVILLPFLLQFCTEFCKLDISKLGF